MQTVAMKFIDAQRGRAREGEHEVDEERERESVCE